MSDKLKKKSILMVVIGLISLTVLGMFLVTMQTNLSVQSQKKDTARKLSQIDGLLVTAEESARQATVTYDDIYQSKAESLAYMAREKAGIAACTDRELKECADLMDITNALILDHEGNVIAKAGKSPADFTRSRYNQLRTVFETGAPSEPFQVQTEGQLLRYYGAKIDSDTMAVIENDPAELTQLIDNTSSWESILANFRIGMNGYAFAVSSRDYTFLYHPDPLVTGTDALDAGIMVEYLEDETYTWMTINGRRFYCGVTDMDDAYIICAVPESDIIASRNITIGIILFIFFAVMTIVITYAVFMMGDEERNGFRNPQDYKKVGKLIFQKQVGRKTAVISAVGLICILVCSFYMQTLFSMTRQSMSSRQRAREVQVTMDKNAAEVDLITQQYNSRYLNKCQTAAYILTRKPELRTRADLKQLKDILDVEAVSIFDEDGRISATSASYTNFAISDDPEDQSYPFNTLLVGNDYLIQEARPDEASGEYVQYIGVSLRDAKDNADGFVQIAVTPSRLDDILKSTRISSILSSIRTGVNGFAFAVTKENKTFAYYPEEKMIGRSALEYGMKEKQFRDEYCDYITVGSGEYYGSSLETDDYYIYVVVPAEELSGSRIGTTLASAGASFICLFLVFLLLSFDSLSAAPGGVKKGREDDGGMIDIVMPDGRIRKTTSAAKRWSNLSVKWIVKTPEQKIAVVLKGIFSLLAIIICLGVLLKDRFFDENSVFSYVLNGGWERGINIFAVTGCILILCVISVGTMVLREILRLLSQTFSMRGETVCRLISSFLKYVSVIVIMYYCFALFGVDTATLLASAGILSLIIGLGAKTLVSDILAGLFIIFEGEFRVGDIVTIGDWRGTVVEIGVRTTKIEDTGKNIKIISNSSVSGVINMTKQHSFACCEIGVKGTEALERVEAILKKEFPNMRKHLPEIVDGPFYSGVVALNGGGVTIRVSAQCKESDRITLQRGLNREMKLLFDQYEIQS